MQKYELIRKQKYGKHHSASSNSRKHSEMPTAQRKGQ